jgi:lysophospholipase L1-like esterase
MWSEVALQSVLRLGQSEALSPGNMRAPDIFRRLLSPLFLFIAGIVSAQSPAVVVDRDFYWSALRSQLVNERFIPPNLPIFFGDSQIQGMDFSPRLNAVNFGITGDTSYGVAHRMKQYLSIKNARAIFLACGVNDLGFGKQFDKSIVTNYGRVFEAIPPHRRIFILGIFPVIESEFPGYNTRIQEVNSELRKLCMARRECRYVDLRSDLTTLKGEARKEYMQKDGLHLNDAGRTIVIDASIRALSQ